jgi:lysophospholipase L1-like esterase
MKIVCLGDSLTEGDYGVYNKSGIANVKPQNYPYFLSLFLNCEVKNFGRCGATPKTYLDFYNRGGVDVKGADVIIIMLGTNGGLSLTDNNDYLQIINNCHRDCENAKVVLCTPPHATINPKMSNCGYKPNVDNATAEVKQIAKDKNLALIDLNSFNGFNDDNENIMQPNDGLHFSELGYKTLAEFIKNQLKSLYPQLF